ncbi:putative membrane-anchored protein [Pedobacter sp. UYEF25]
MGGTLGDFLSMTLNFGYLASVVVSFIIFTIALSFQLKTKILNLGFYWFVIIRTTTVGTEIADFMDSSLGLGYMLGSLILFAALISTRAIWYKPKGNLTIYQITAFRVEIFYWIAILFFNGLGTTFGDFLSDNVGLGYGGYGGLVTAAARALVTAVHH